eukprot:CAMPEP_0180282126 /NCGR_PEP_ID=MMETSP0988-20121125/9624_1 /TAXON_ID=697907 /ORGANISM="non described non described, Strain CCMP2293" /LENGTH=85 /DNA_ID=CAMNT_0022254267 /DNA_START=115 /DNA_END=369 /DNA_ORIENTATION=+
MEPRGADELLVRAAQVHLDLADVVLTLESIPVLHVLEKHSPVFDRPPNLDIQRQVAVPSGLVVVVPLVEPITNRSNPHSPLGHLP